MELCDIPAYELSLLLRQRQISAEEVTRACLERIDAVDGRSGALDAGSLTPEDEQKVHAFITITRERALNQARAVDQKLAAGDDPGLLAGISFTAKDVFCVRVTPSTAASRILANYTAPYTATPVARMEEAGAVMIGKVNLDEFTYGSSNESSAFQPS